MSCTYTVAVIGGGFSGTLTAIQLLRTGVSGPIALIEKSQNIGRGAAYGTKCSSHLLNVPAANMSAFADEPHHFLQWFIRQEPNAHALSFAPRYLYGQYIEETFQKTLKESGVRLEIINAEITNLNWDNSNKRWSLKSESGREVTSEFIVLATGHPAPQSPVPISLEVERSGRFKLNPWRNDCLENLESSSPILLVGSGLTAADVIIESNVLGFNGPIYVLSRRGFIPRKHELPILVPPPNPGIIAESSLLTALKKFRSLSRIAHGNWRAIIDSLRPEIQNIWQRFSIVEQRRFLRHLRPYWEVHRHRIAPEVANLIEKIGVEGRLHLLAGRIESIEDSKDSIMLRYRPRGEIQIEELRVQRIINCTGPATSISLCDSKLTQMLLTEGLCRMDSLGIGLDTNHSGALISKTGHANDRFYSIGSLRKGKLWETTAVRELRSQAKEIAETIRALESLALTA